jgi:hypothetical protein
MSAGTIAWLHAAPAAATVEVSAEKRPYSVPASGSAPPATVKTMGSRGKMKASAVWSSRSGDKTERPASRPLQGEGGAYVPRPGGAGTAASKKSTDDEFSKAEGLKGVFLVPRYDAARQEYTGLADVYRWDLKASRFRRVGTAAFSKTPPAILPPIASKEVLAPPPEEIEPTTNGIDPAPKLEIRSPDDFDAKFADVVREFWRSHLAAERGEIPGDSDRARTAQAPPR